MPAPSPYTLNAMFADLAHFQDVVNRVHAGLRNPANKAKLGELLEQLQKAREQAEKVIPPVLEQKLRSAQQAKSDMETLAQRVREKQTELEAQRKQAAASLPSAPSLPSVPEAPVEQKSGHDLRIELLQAYGGLKIKEKPAWE
jgi:hypothetical protein